MLAPAVEYRHDTGAVRRKKRRYLEPLLDGLSRPTLVLERFDGQRIPGEHVDA